MILFKPAKHLENVKMILRRKTTRSEGRQLRLRPAHGWEDRPRGQAGRTYDEAEFLVVPRVHGLALLHAAAARVGLRLHVKSDSSKLKYDVPLSLWGLGGEEEERAAFTVGHDIRSHSPGALESPHPGETATDTDIGGVSVGSAHSSSPAARPMGPPWLSATCSPSQVTGRTSIQYLEFLKEPQHDGRRVTGGSHLWEPTGNVLLEAQ